jgi:5-methylcytosine-specific restriction endonuclease McrA
MTIFRAHWASDDYALYLRSPYWGLLRVQVIARAGGVCDSCGLVVPRGAWEVHHTRYPALLGTEPHEWLVFACRTCHEALHAAEPPRRETLPEFVARVRALNQRDRAA